MEDFIQIIKSEPELEIIDIVQRPFKCEICTKSFSLQNTLKIHKLTHSGEKPFKCESCNESFILSSILKTHQLIHVKKKRFICLICDLSFDKKSIFRKHKVSHIGEKPFKCKFCNRTFVFKYNQNRHELIHCKNRKTNENNKRFSCVLCRAHFLEEEQLKQHKQQHKCKICGEWFRRIRTKKLHFENFHLKLNCDKDIESDESICSVKEEIELQIFDEID